MHATPGPLAALVAALLLPAPGLASPARPAVALAEVAPADAKVTIPVGGMSCGGCVNTISSRLRQLDGVKAVEVSLEKKRAFVTYDAARVSAKALVDAIRDAGFEPGVPLVN
jgi:copper chaperone